MTKMHITAVKAYSSSPLRIMLKNDKETDDKNLNDCIFCLNSFAKIKSMVDTESSEALVNFLIPGLNLWGRSLYSPLVGSLV